VLNFTPVKVSTHIGLLESLQWSSLCRQCNESKALLSFKSEVTTEELLGPVTLIMMSDIVTNIILR
jgi:hypothetical protein